MKSLLKCFNVEVLKTYQIRVFQKLYQIPKFVGVFFEYVECFEKQNLEIKKSWRIFTAQNI